MCFFVFLCCFVFGLVFCFCDSSLQLNMLNDLAKAMKVLDGKKKCQVMCSACLVQLALTKTGLPALALEAKNIQACKEEPSETSLSLVGSGAVIDLDICSENSSEAADTTSSSSDE